VERQSAGKAGMERFLNYFFSSFRMERQTVYRFKHPGGAGGHERKDKLFELMKGNDFGFAGSYLVVSERTKTVVADIVSGGEYVYYVISKDDKNESARKEEERFKTLLDEF
jgi:hypothetical protein